MTEQIIGIVLLTVFVGMMIIGGIKNDKDLDI